MFYHSNFTIKLFYFFNLIVLFIALVVVARSGSSSNSVLGVHAESDDTGSSIADQLKAKNIPYSIDFSFTARSFLPVTCLSQAEMNAYWPPRKGVKAAADGDSCPFYEDILAGKIKGHPDFEIGANLNPLKNGYRWYLPGTSGFSNPLQSPILDGKGNLVNESLNSISEFVENYLSTSPSGLSKPVYACTVNETCGFSKGAWLGENLRSTAGLEAFKQWYEDDPVVNKRVGFKLRLSIANIEDVINNGSAPVYVYDSAKTEAKQFWPLDQFIGTDEIWPLTDKEKTKSYTQYDLPHKYWFTTEYHSYFQYNGGETFEFSGDDDVWVFINGKLAVDLGGLHVALTSSISLSDHENELGLKKGGIYSISMFHAERHIRDSNFKITTNLVQSCNVERVGAEVLNWGISTLSTLVENEDVSSLLGATNKELLVQDSFKLIGGKSWGIMELNETTNTSEIVLTQYGVLNSVGYAWLRQPQNVGPGFVTEFEFSVTLNDTDPSNGMGGEGFAFVFHRAPTGITNMNGGSGGNLGFKNIQNSIAVAFDLCVDRTNGTCNTQQVRLHLSPIGYSEGNSPSAKTRTVYASLNKNLKTGARHKVKIQYLGQPDWIQVFIDDSLYLQQSDMNLNTVLGGREAYLGFTASTGSDISRTSTIKINYWNIRTVPIDIAQTVYLAPDSEQFTANGRSEFQIKLFSRDGCKTRVNFGGYSDLAWGYIVPKSVKSSTLDTNTNETGGRRALGDCNQPFEYPPRGATLARIIDNSDGSYILGFSTAIEGEYELHFGFGPDCPEISKCVNITQSEASSSSSTSAGTRCWKTNYGTIKAVPVEATLSPTPSNDFLLSPQVALGLAIGGGTVFLCGVCCAVFMCRYRQRWREDKKFIEEGKLITLQRDIRPSQKEIELTNVANRVQSTREQIHQLKTISWHEDRSQDVKSLRDQTDEIKKYVQDLRKRKMEDEDNERSKLSKPVLPSRTQKRQFAPQRIDWPGMEFAQEDDNFEFSRPTAADSVTVLIDGQPPHPEPYREAKKGNFEEENVDDAKISEVIDKIGNEVRGKDVKEANVDLKASASSLSASATATRATPKSSSTTKPTPKAAAATATAPSASTSLAVPSSAEMLDIPPPPPPLDDYQERASNAGSSSQPRPTLSSESDARARARTNTSASAISMNLNQVPSRSLASNATTQSNINNNNTNKKRNRNLPSLSITTASTALLGNNNLPNPDN